MFSVIIALAILQLVHAREYINIKVGEGGVHIVHPSLPAAIGDGTCSQFRFTRDKTVSISHNPNSPQTNSVVILKAILTPGSCVSDCIWLQWTWSDELQRNSKQLLQSLPLSPQWLLLWFCTCPTRSSGRCTCSFCLTQLLLVYPQSRSNKVDSLT